jgi:hypothetical protein
MIPKSGHRFSGRIMLNKKPGIGADVMKSFVIACAAAVVIAVCGWVVLDSMQVPADQAFKAPNSVRLGA